MATVSPSPPLSKGRKAFPPALLNSLPRLSWGRAGRRLRQEWRKPPVRWALAVAAVTLLLVVAALYLKAQPRSVVVAVTSRAVTVELDGAAMNGWLLRKATICYRRATPLSPLGAPKARPSVCNLLEFESEEAEDLQLSWPEGTTVQLSRTGGANGLSILLQTPGSADLMVANRVLTAGSRIEVPADAWAATAALTLSGKMLLGEAPAPGSQATLIDGSYEFREPMPLQPRPAAVALGRFFPGDTVAIVDAEGAQLPTVGFVEPLDDGQAGLKVTAYAPQADAIEVKRFGAETLRVAPTWMDRIFTDTLLQTIALLVGVVAAVAGLVLLLHQTGAVINGRRRRG